MCAMEYVEGYVERIQTAIANTMRKLGPEIMRHKELGLTGPQFHLMQLIARAGPCNITHLAEQMEVKPSAITFMVDRLVHSGFVSRLNDEHDRRVVLISMTEKGREVLNEAQRRANRVIVRYFSRLEPNELEFLVAVLDKLANIASTTDGDDHR